MPSNVLVKNVLFVYRTPHSAKMHQCLKFEHLRVLDRTRARMCRGDNRGFLRDSWTYNKYGELESYTKFYSVLINNLDDTHKLNGVEYNCVVFLEGGQDANTLNAIFSRVRNTSGVVKLSDEVCDDEIKERLR